MEGRPLDVLEASLNETVTVSLKDGTAYRGELVGYDQHMNVVLEADGAAAAGAGEHRVVEDTTIIRGDNVIAIRP